MSWSGWRACAHRSRPRRTGFKLTGARLDQFGEGVRSTGRDARKDPVVGHLVGVDEAIGLRFLAQRQHRLGEAPVAGREGGTEYSASGNLWCTLREWVRPGLPHRTQLLRIALVNAAPDGEVLVDPDVDAAGECLALEAAPYDDEGLFVLRADRVQQLFAG